MLETTLAVSLRSARPIFRGQQIARYSVSPANHTRLAEARSRLQFSHVTESCISYLRETRREYDSRSQRAAFQGSNYMYDNARRVCPGRHFRRCSRYGALAAYIRRSWKIASTLPMNTESPTSAATSSHGASKRGSSL